MRSYPSAKAEVAQLGNVRDVFVKASARVNNRAENSDQPSRERERHMQAFRRPELSQAFLSSFGPIRQHFTLKRHLLRASLYRRDPSLALIQPAIANVTKPNRPEPAPPTARRCATGRPGMPRASLNALVHRIAVLSKAHQLSQAANPCADALVRELLAKTRRAYAQRGVRMKKQRALTKDSLQALLATCDASLRGKRDWGGRTCGAK